MLFATDAGEVGLNLQHAASACIHLDLPWNPAVLEQRTGRIFRMGRKLPVEVYYLIASSGLEARIASPVSDKKALFGGLFDGQSDEVRFERSGSFLNAMIQLAEPLPPHDPGRDDDPPEEGEAAEEVAGGQSDSQNRAGFASSRGRSRRARHRRPRELLVPFAAGE